MKINALKFNEIRCYLAIITSSLLVILTFIGMMIRFFYFEGTAEGTSGLASFKMFTILSNVLSSVIASLSIPYAIDGLRTNNYHLPRWIVDTLYVGVTCVTMTFLISLCLLTSLMGFSNIMFNGTNLLFHTICPILAILLFIFLDSYHNIKLYKTFIAIAPIVIYLTIYAIMVFGLGKWQDFYKLNSFMPWIVSVLLALPVAFLIATGLRLAHNIVHKKQKQNLENYYLKDFECKDIHEAIAILASKNKDDLKGDLIIPRRIIKLLMNRFEVKEDLNFYLKEYLDK